MNASRLNRKLISDGRDRSPAPALVVNTTHGVRKPGGWGWAGSNGQVRRTPVDDLNVTEKPNKASDMERSFLLQKKSMAENMPYAEKIMGPRVLCPRGINDGALTSKINHISQDYIADPSETLKQGYSNPAQVSLPLKVGEEDRRPVKHRLCMTDKITVSNQSGGLSLARNGQQQPSVMGKVSDPSTYTRDSLRPI